MHQAIHEERKKKRKTKGKKKKKKKEKKKGDEAKVKVRGYVLPKRWQDTLIHTMRRFLTKVVKISVMII